MEIESGWGMTFLYFGGTNSNYIVYGTLLSMSNQCRSFLFIVCAIFFCLYLFCPTKILYMLGPILFLVTFCEWMNTPLARNSVSVIDLVLGLNGHQRSFHVVEKHYKPQSSWTYFGESWMKFWFGLRLGIGIRVTVWCDSQTILVSFTWHFRHE